MLGIRPIYRHVNRWYLRRASTATISPPKRPPLLSRCLRFGTLATLSAPGFVTYAYTCDELCEMTESFRERYLPSDQPVTLGDVNPLIANAKAVCAEAIDFYLNYRTAIEMTIQDCFGSPPDKLLPDMCPVLQKYGGITLVLDLNETLVHSDWKNVLIYRGEDSFKRPGLDAFLGHLMGACELVLYTDELSLYVTHLLVNLENNGFQYDLPRRYTTFKDGKRYKDLSKLNRDPSKILYVSGNALENCLQPENCLPIKPWKKEMDDTTLTDILPFLEYVMKENPDDIRPILASFKDKDIATECKHYKRRMQELEETRMEERRVLDERKKLTELRKGHVWTLSECGKGHFWRT